ncbi:MAG: leucine-rich repeat domain-containing protein [Clostridia bacterium]|nr:leucine-rich repeat domain-containing protein [Clostridia bacterium]
MKKKIFLLIMVVSVLLCLFAISVSAADYDTTRKVTLDSGEKVALYDENGNALTWYMDSGTLTSIKTADILSTGTTTIDSVSYKTFKFTGVSESTMVVVNFQDEKLGDLEAFNTKFEDSTVLEYCYMPDTLIRLSVNYDSANVFRGTTKCKYVEFTENCELNFIGKYSFSKATALKEIFIPAGVTTFPDGSGWDWGCFWDCTSLTSVRFAENSQLKNVPSGTFRGCASLTDILLPDSVETLGIYVFRDSGIVNSPFSPTSNCTYINKWAFYGCAKLENINIPRNATFNTAEKSEGVGLFHNCSSLVEVNFHPDSINTMYPAHMFTGCTALKEIQLPNSLTQLPCRMFNNCSSLETIILGANVVGINNLRESSTDHNSFTYNCNNLKYVYLPKTLNIDAESHASACHVFGYGGNITFYYNGTYDEAVALQNQFKNNVTICEGKTTTNTNNGKITGATIISLEEYNKLTEINKCYLVYDGNTCDMFYNGVHGESQVRYDFEGEDYTTNLLSFTGCQRCNETIPAFVCGPLFTNKGYSKVEDGSMFTYGISIDEENIKTYKSKTGNTFSYGFIVGAVPTTPTGNIIDVNGNALIEKSVVVDFATVQFSNFTIYNVKMCDIATTQQTMPVYCCAYIIDGSQVSYIGNSVTTVAASISSSAIEVIEKTTPPAIGDQNA